MAGSKICARDGCKKKVPTGRRGWCSHECRELARGVRVHPRQTRKEQAVVTDLQEQLKATQAELALYQKPIGGTPPKWLTRAPRKTQEHHGTLVAFLSDTHFGEVVDPQEVNMYNAYNLGIAQKRLARFFERTVAIARQYWSGVTYDGIVLVHGGDIVSGDIHDELTETNEISTYETVEWAIPLLRSGIEMWEQEFGRVHNESIPGNHGRNTQRPKHKRRSANNADTHIGRLLAQHFDEDPNITFNVPHSIDSEFDVYGYRFSVEHGDQAKGGDGQVGALGPAKRLTLRKMMQSSEEGRPFDYLLMGHFHQLIFAQTQGFIMNGSLKGYDEYARAWHFRPERAQQALMLVTPENGISMTAPIIVQNRD